MYAECDDDDKNSLNSSFWSDGEDEDEEEVEIERMVGKEAWKSAEEPLVEASEEEKSDAKESKGSEEGSGGADGDDEGSSWDSPALSFLTSGYGTSRPEEQDCTAEQVDQHSRADLSELRDDEDDLRSVCSHFWFQEPGVTLPQNLSPEPGGPGGPGAAGGDGESKDEECVSERFTMGEEIVEGGRVDADQHERPEEEEEQELQEAAESGQSQESPCEQDITFIDSTLDSRSNYSKLQGSVGAPGGAGGCSPAPPPVLTALVCADAASCLEERLEELRLSEARDQDQGVRSWSDSSETEDTFSDAFQTYARGLVGGEDRELLGALSWSLTDSLLSSLATAASDPKRSPVSQRSDQQDSS